MASAWAGPLKKSGSPKGDVLGAGIDLAANVFEHDFALHDAEDTVVDRHDRAVAAEMLAAAAGFGVAGDPEPAVGHQQVRVLAQRRQAGAVGGMKLRRSSEIGAPRSARRALLERSIGPAPRVRRVAPLRLAGAASPSASCVTSCANALEFTAQNRFDAEFAQIGLVDRSVQAVEAEMRARIQPPHRFDQADREARGRVHGNVEGDDAGCANRFFVQTSGEIGRGRRLRRPRGAATRPATPGQRAGGQVRRSR